MNSAEEALPDTSSINEHSTDQSVMSRNTQSFAADITLWNYWSILTVATIMALLIQETQKHRNDLRMQMTEGTTQMMND